MQKGADLGVRFFIQTQKSPFIVGATGVGKKYKISLQFDDHHLVMNFWTNRLTYLFTRPPGPPDPEDAVEPLSLWSSLPQPQGHMVIREAAGLNAGALYKKIKTLHVLTDCNIFKYILSEGVVQYQGPKVGSFPKVHVPEVQMRISILFWFVVFLER